jgi:hypothetical protein
VNKRDGEVGEKMKPYKTDTDADTIQFVKESVLSVSDLTRTKKLTEILNSYAESHSRDIYIVQNSKNKQARAAIADLDYLQDLLRYKEAVDAATDEVMYELALERKNDETDVGLEQVIKRFNLDEERILKLAETIEEE